MSARDASHGSTAILESIVKGIIRNRPKPYRLHQYVGLRSNRSLTRQKYKTCEFADFGRKMRVRKLTAEEMAEFRSGVQSVIDGAGK